MVEKRRGDTGVTLIEVLVVLSLIAISAGAVTFALPSTPSQKSLAQEAHALAARLNLIAERALVEGQYFKFYWDQTTYGFQVWADQDWDALPDSSFAGRESVGSGMSLRDQHGARGGEVRITPNLLPPGRGILKLEVSSGSDTQLILFDGLSARLQGSKL